jgi:hypothetical protein
MLRCAAPSRRLLSCQLPRLSLSKRWHGSHDHSHETTGWKSIIPGFGHSHAGHDHGVAPLGQISRQGVKGAKGDDGSKITLIGQ